MLVEESINLQLLEDLWWENSSPRVPEAKKDSTTDTANVENHHPVGLANAHKHHWSHSLVLIVPSVSEPTLLSPGSSPLQVPVRLPSPTGPQQWLFDKPNPGESMIYNSPESIVAGLPPTSPNAIGLSDDVDRRQYPIPSDQKANSPMDTSNSPHWPPVFRPIPQYPLASQSQPQFSPMFYSPFQGAQWPAMDPSAMAPPFAVPKVPIHPASSRHAHFDEDPVVPPLPSPYSSPYPSPPPIISPRPETSKIPGVDSSPAPPAASPVQLSSEQNSRHEISMLGIRLANLETNMATRLFTQMTEQAIRTERSQDVINDKLARMEKLATSFGPSERLQPSYPAHARIPDTIVAENGSGKPPADVGLVTSVDALHSKLAAMYAKLEEIAHPIPNADPLPAVLQPRPPDSAHMPHVETRADASMNAHPTLPPTPPESTSSKVAALQEIPFSVPTVGTPSIILPVVASTPGHSEKKPTFWRRTLRNLLRL